MRTFVINTVESAIAACGCYGGTLLVVHVSRGTATGRSCFTSNTHLIVALTIRTRISDMDRFRDRGACRRSLLSYRQRRRRLTVITSTCCDSFVKMIAVSIKGTCVLVPRGLCETRRLTQTATPPS